MNINSRGFLFWLACGVLAVATLFARPVSADPILDATARGRATGCAAEMWRLRGYTDQHAMIAREYYAALGRARATGRCEDAEMAATRSLLCSRGIDRMVGSLCSPNPADEPIPPVVAVPSVPAPPAPAAPPVVQPPPAAPAQVIVQRREEATTVVAAPVAPAAPPQQVIVRLPPAPAGAQAAPPAATPARPG